MNEKLLEALTMDLDAITFWVNEGKITPATAIKLETEHEGRKQDVQIQEVLVA